MDKVFVSDDDIHFYCKACDRVHILSKRMWDWNKDKVNPTIYSPIRMSWKDKDGIENLCHFFLVEGKVRYFCDCTHKMKDLNVTLDDWNDKYSGIPQ